MRSFLLAVGCFVVVSATIFAVSAALYGGEAANPPTSAEEQDASQPVQADAVAEVAEAAEVVAEVAQTEEVAGDEEVVEAEPASDAEAVEESYALEEETTQSIDEQATHQQTGVIEISEATQVNAFCLAHDGRILAACGAGPGEVKVLDADGKALESWPLSIKPEAINVAPDETVLVAGGGKLIRLSPQGKILQEADSPHAIALRENRDKLREQAIANLSGRQANVAEQVKLYENMVTELTAKKEKEELNDQEKQILEILPAHIESLKELAKEQESEPEPEVAEEQVERQIDSIAEHKLHVASISSDGENVYVATPSLTGYTFDVWQTAADFSDGKVVVADLRGCCGHMDVQACSSGLYVAENARHRVARFDGDGNSVGTWGKPDRTGLEGFTSCCNPMNVCFNRKGEVFTAESSTGRIKRFSADGEFQAFVGDVKLVPGCKNVSIAVSDDDARVYMLDITRNHIVMMERKGEGEPSGAEVAEPGEAQ